MDTCDYDFFVLLLFVFLTILFGLLTLAYRSEFHWHKRNSAEWERLYHKANDKFDALQAKLKELLK